MSARQAVALCAAAVETGSLLEEHRVRRMSGAKTRGVNGPEGRRLLVAVSLFASAGAFTALVIFRTFLPAAAAAVSAAVVSAPLWWLLVLRPRGDVDPGRAGRLSGAWTGAAIGLLSHLPWWWMQPLFIEMEASWVALFFWGLAMTLSSWVVAGWATAAVGAMLGAYLDPW